MDEKKEVLEMLEILIDSAKEAEKKSDTLIERVSLDSFEWILNSAINLINRSTL